MSNPKYHEWRTDKLIKGWIIGTLSKEILREVVKLNSIVDVSKALKKTFNKSTMDRELTLHHHL